MEQPSTLNNRADTPKFEPIGKNFIYVSGIILMLSAIACVYNFRLFAEMFYSRKAMELFEIPASDAQTFLNVFKIGCCVFLGFISIVLAKKIKYSSILIIFAVAFLCLFGIQLWFASTSFEHFMYLFSEAYSLGMFISAIFIIIGAAQNLGVYRRKLRFDASVQK